MVRDMEMLAYQTIKRRARTQLFSSFFSFSFSPPSVPYGMSQVVDVAPVHNTRNEANNPNRGCKVNRIYTIVNIIVCLYDAAH